MSAQGGSDKSEDSEDEATQTGDSPFRMSGSAPQPPRAGTPPLHGALPVVPPLSGDGLERPPSRKSATPTSLDGQRPPSRRSILSVPMEDDAILSDEDENAVATSAAPAPVADEMLVTSLEGIVSSLELSTVNNGVDNFPSLERPPSRRGPILNSKERSSVLSVSLEQLNQNNEDASFSPSNTDVTGELDESTSRSTSSFGPSKANKSGKRRSTKCVRFPDDPNSLATVVIMTPRQRPWRWRTVETTSRDQPPFQRCWHCSWLLGEYLFIFGGVFVSPSGELFCLKDLHRLSLTTLKWTPVDPRGEAPRGCWASAYCAVGGRAYLFGGRDHNFVISSALHRYDPDTPRTGPGSWKLLRRRTNDTFHSPSVDMSLRGVVGSAIKPSSAESDGPRLCAAGLCGDSANERLILFGGISSFQRASSDSGVFDNDVWVFDIVNCRWHLQPTKDPPTPRAWHAQCMLGHFVYVHGGADRTSVFNELHVLDTRNWEWQNLSDVWGDIPPHSHSSVLIPMAPPPLGPLLLFGGGIPYPVDTAQCYWLFSPDTFCWDRRRGMGFGPPPVLFGHSAAVYHSGEAVIVFGGQDSGSHYSHSLFVLERGDSDIKFLSASKKKERSRSSGSQRKADTVAVSERVPTPGDRERRRREAEQPVNSGIHNGASGPGGPVQGRGMPIVVRPSSRKGGRESSSGNGGNSDNSSCVSNNVGGTSVCSLSGSSDSSLTVSNSSTSTCSLLERKGSPPRRLRPLSRQYESEGRALQGKQRARSGDRRPGTMGAPCEKEKILHLGSAPAGSLHFNTDKDWKDYYDVTRQLGRGAFSTVWLVRERSSKKRYSAKKTNLATISMDKRLKVLSEVRIHSSLPPHPHIVPFREAFVVKERLAVLVMSYCSQGDLFSLICRQRDKQEYLNEDVILFWFVQLLMAVSHLHSYGLLHTDLKSANVLFDDRMLVQLCDFSMTNKPLPPHSRETLKHRKELNGTPEYMSPQMLQYSAPSYASDVWALGILLFELCNLCVPFSGHSMQETVEKVLRAPLPLVNEVYSVALRKLVTSLLVRKESLRPQLSTIFELPIIASAVREYHSMSLQDTTSSSALSSLCHSNPDNDATDS